MTEGEIPVHTPGAARRQRPMPGKRFRHEGGDFTCTVPGNLTISGNFRRILLFKKCASGAQTRNPWLPILPLYHYTTVTMLYLMKNIIISVNFLGTFVGIYFTCGEYGLVYKKE